jgi:RES domain-containing protein
MRAFRLCRSAYPAYDGEGARRGGGRWNSRGVPVLYMSENRSLAVLEILVHLSGTLPDKYLLGAADIPDDLTIETVADEDLPDRWSTLSPTEQLATRRLGDAWVERKRSSVLSVPSVIVGERNYVLNPAHPDFARIKFAEPEPFGFDLRLIWREEPPSAYRETHRDPA